MRKTVEYLLSFLEGIITFISPCLLPMLPIYVSYFAGQKADNKQNGFKNVLGFVLGFTIIFVLLGAFAGTLGQLLKQYAVLFNVITGLVVVLFGLHFLGVFKIRLLDVTKRMNYQAKNLGFFSSILFGIVFSIGWTPCVGAFLGSALMLAAQGGETLKGVFMLLAFSVGLGIPFIVSAVLIDKLKKTFAFIKRNYQIINYVSGGLLVLVGILMMTGLMGYFLSLFTF